MHTTQRPGPICMESKIYSPLSNHVYVLNGDDIETIDIIMWSASRAIGRPKRV